MKSTFVYLVLLACPFLLHAQHGFRPIMDSTATCSYYNHTYGFSENASTSKQILEVFYIVEKMPKPKLSENEIAHILKNHIRLNEQEMTFNGEIYLQCVVNCKGKAGDFQILRCPNEYINVGCQLLHLFREKINEWESGVQRGKNIDVLIKIKIELNQGKFNVVAPLN
jgi:hypothetical protein